MLKMDKEELNTLFTRRLDETDEAMRRYYEGRIDGHCLQNAIDEDELIAFAAQEGFRVTWRTAMAVVSS